MLEQARARILVVDDESAIRRTVDAVLRRQGYEVATAANGEEALGWLMQKAFDLVLIDLKLPGMNGLQFAHYAQRCQPGMAILFLTGSSDFNGLPVEMQVGHFDYVLKTASPEEVLEAVANALDHQFVMRRAA